MARSRNFVALGLLACVACFAGLCVAAPPPPSSALAAGPNRVRRAAGDAWLRLLAEYARGGAPASGGGDAADQEGDWFPRPIPISLPIGRGAGGKPAEVPVLILPVPVPAAPTPSPQCSADRTSLTQKDEEIERGVVHGVLEKHQHRASPGPVDDRQGATTGGRVAGGGGISPARTSAATRVPTPPHPPLGARYHEEPTVPHLDYIVSSQQLVELFRAQVAPEPELPPAVIPDYAAGEEAAAAAPDALASDVGPAPRRVRQVRLRSFQLPGQLPTGAAVPAPFSVPSEVSPSTPPTPRFDRSVLLRGELTVPRSGYTEPYSVWWDAGSGAARVDLHGGATSAYRTVLPDGRVQSVQMRIDRSGEREVRRCVVGEARAPTASDRDLPGVPDLQDFTFSGYSDAEFGRVERWTRTVAGGGGELGGARGEALTFRHELLVARSPDNRSTTPLKYSVAVDSSVLGADCDGYVHRYTELRDQHHEPDQLRLDLGEMCEEVESTSRQEIVEPLREYTLPHRDPRYDADYRKFKSDHRRQYMDDTEEAVRKTVMVQHSRFVDSGNRQGATFSMGVNHLGDRLDEELRLLRGVREGEGGGGEAFPHSREDLAAMRARLPRAFDWRERGAVTHVRNQGTCSSCWAMAVTGAVEGALFVRTRRLVPLSEQCLVDCAGPFGGHGCRGTWPSAAYEYVRARGLPALAAYPPFQEKVLECADRRVPPVTHITDHVNVTKNSVQALKVAIRRHAPTVVIIDATAKSFAFYKQGVVNDERCRKNKPEHAVLAVGWGERRGEPHFIIKNSWSDTWGDGGYVRLAAAPNTCGVLSRPSYPRLERTDVDSIPPDTEPARE